MKLNTNDYYIIEILIAVSFVASLIWLESTLKERHKRIESEPTITDLLQQQEMIDYAKSQGRTIRF